MNLPVTREDVIDAGEAYRAKMVAFLEMRGWTTGLHQKFKWEKKDGSWANDPYTAFYFESERAE